MKVLNKISFLLTFLLVASMTFVSCTKEGPAGLAGKDGKDGKDGEDGINGLDGTATCMQCHDNSQAVDARVLQWESSFHATGDAFARNTAIAQHAIPAKVSAANLMELMMPLLQVQKSPTPTHLTATPAIKSTKVTPLVIWL